MIVLLYTLKNSFLFIGIGLLLYIFSYFYLKKVKKIEINSHFINSIIPYVFLGVFIRLIFGDIYHFDFLIFSYPYLFVLLGIIYFIFFEINWLVNKSNLKIVTFAGYLFIIPLFLWYLFIIKNWGSLFLIILISVFFLFVLFYFFKIFNIIINNYTNRLFLLSEIIDSFSTFYAFFFMKDKFIEQHFISEYLLTISPFLYVFIKLFVSILYLYFVDKYIKNNSENSYYKLIIIILAFSTGFRDLFLISVA